MAEIIIKNNPDEIIAVDLNNNILILDSLLAKVSEYHPITIIITKGSFKFNVGLNTSNTLLWLNVGDKFTITVGGKLIGLDVINQNQMNFAAQAIGDKFIIVT